MIVAANIFKIDVTRMLIDHESEELVPEEEKNMKIRYSLINSVLGLPAIINHGAAKWKWCCCNAY